MKYRIRKTYQLYGNNEPSVRYMVEQMTEIAEGGNLYAMFIARFDVESDARKHIELLKSLPEDEIITL